MVPGSRVQTTNKTLTSALLLVCNAFQPGSELLAGNNAVLPISKIYTLSIYKNYEHREVFF